MLTHLSGLLAGGIGRQAQLVAETGPFARALTRDGRVVAANATYRALVSRLDAEPVEAVELPPPGQLLAGNAEAATILQRLAMQTAAGPGREKHRLTVDGAAPQVGKGPGR